MTPSGSRLFISFIVISVVFIAANAEENGKLVLCHWRDISNGKCQGSKRNAITRSFHTDKNSMLRIIIPIFIGVITI